MDCHHLKRGGDFKRSPTVELVVLRDSCAFVTCHYPIVDAIVDVITQFVSTYVHGGGQCYHGGSFSTLASAGEC